MIFMSDEVTNENHWEIASPVTKKSLFMETNALFYISSHIDPASHSLRLCSTDTVLRHPSKILGYRRTRTYG